MQRSLLAVLACECGKSISNTRLITLLWGDTPPDGAMTTLRSHVMRLRKAVETDADGSTIKHAGDGYALMCRPEQIDSIRFEILTAQGQEALETGKAAECVARLDEALNMWSGQPLSGVPDRAWVRHQVQRLGVLRRIVAKTRIDAELALCRYDVAVAGLRNLIVDHPEDEKLHSQLALALYRDQRIDEAVEACKQGIRALYRIGLDSKHLRDLQENILKRAPELAQVLPDVERKVPHQLPPDVTGFTGRQLELNQLHSLVATSSTKGTPKLLISAISGTGGVGKTALAVHLAHQISPEFPDGQLYVNLHGYDERQLLMPTQVVDKFLRALGVADRAIPKELDERVDLYRSLLADKKMLVILDNASSAEQIRDLFPNSRSCLVIITSRNTMGSIVVDDGAHLLSLDVLKEAEAVDLLTRVIARPLATDETAYARKIVRLCGGLPLAVRIAGAKILARPSLTLRTFCELLDDERYRLEVLNVGDVGVRTCFALSYHSLSPEVRWVFRLLGLIAGPDFSAEGAAALSGRGTIEVRRILDNLVDAHLVEINEDGDRFRFHDLLRLYSRQRAADEESIAEQRAAVGRLLTWYRSVADVASDSVMQIQRMERSRTPNPMVDVSSRALSLQWLETERPSLVAAVDQAADYEMWQEAWELADSQWGFFYLKKHWTDWENSHRSGLKAARQVGNTEGEAWMLTNLGVCYWDQHRPRQSIERWRAALDIACQYGYTVCEARALNGLALAHRDMEMWEEALRYSEEALPLRRIAKDRWGEAVNLDNNALILGKLGRLNESISKFEQALEIWARIEDRWGEAVSLNDLARTYSEAHHYELAIPRFREALKIRRSIGDLFGEGESLYHLGVALKEVEGTEAARRCWLGALKIMTQLNASEASDVRERLSELEA